MRGKLAVIGGLVFALAFGAPAAAQAGTAHAKATAAPADTVVGCGTLYDYGNHKYAVINNNNEFVYFEPLSTLGAARRSATKRTPT